MATDVVIVGAGVFGCATAYYLGRHGVKVTVIERDAIGSHASGFALGGLSPLSGTGIPGPLAPLSISSFWLHCELQPLLQQETGIQTGFSLTPTINLAFTEEEARSLQANLPWEQAQEGFKASWAKGKELRSLEPRISPQAIGGAVSEPSGMLDSYSYNLALAQAAERLGAAIRHGEVTGLNLQKGKVTGVRLRTGELACETVLLAMGPWSAAVSPWLGTAVPVEPLKGQILRLRIGGPPVRRVSWAGRYVVSKPDGLVWAGTTEELTGFNDYPTPEGRRHIMDGLLRALPSLADAEVVQQTACLRPLARDGLPILGPVPGIQGLYLATGAGRKGILLSTGAGKAVADLLAKGSAELDLSPFDPGRFNLRPAR